MCIDNNSYVDTTAYGNVNLYPRQEQTRRSGVFDFTLMMSDCYDQTIACKIASYRMGKADGFTVVDGRGIDATTLELIQ